MDSEASGRTVSVREYLARLPAEAASVRAAVEPYRAMTAGERWAAFEALLREMDALLGGRPPIREDGEEPLWRHWADPTLGRPR